MKNNSKNNSKVLSVDAFRAEVLQEVEEICKANGWKFADEQGRGLGQRVRQLPIARQGALADDLRTLVST